jgi:uncharacterized membrane protein YhaH (DUF805 family)
MAFIAHPLLALHGRISRSGCWIGTLILGAISTAAMYLILAIVGISDKAVLLSMIVALVLAYPSYALTAKRFQDHDKPGALALLGIVPVYSVNFLQTFRVIDPYTPTPLYHALNYVDRGCGSCSSLASSGAPQGPIATAKTPLGRAQADARL